MICAILLAAGSQAPAPRAGAADAPPGLVLVGGGRTKIGTDESEVEHWVADPGTRSFAGALSAETPRREVDVASFWLMTTEVTNEQYAAYVRATGVRPPETWGEAQIATGRARHLAAEANEREQALADGRRAPDLVAFDGHAWWLAHWKESGTTGAAWTIPAGDEMRPVVFVDWDDARAYARWAGLRLPTELEYQRAVRGDTARNYPWGNEWEDGRYAATHQDDKRTGAFPVGSFAAGASRQGVFDLAGNVWEWTSSAYLPFPGYQPRAYDSGFGPARRKINAIADWNVNQRVVVGGSFRNGPLVARAAARRGADPAQTTDALGFRCAASLRPGYDLACEVLENELAPHASPRHQDLTEYAAESVRCVEGWAIAAPGGAEPRAGGTGPPGYAVIADHRSVLYTPVRTLAAYDPTGLEKLKASESLVALGFLFLDVAALEPVLDAGTYLVFLRGKGPLPVAAAFTESALSGETTEQLILADLSGGIRAALPSKFEWENLREGRLAWIDPAATPETGTREWPAGSRCLRIEPCVACRASQKGFGFGLTLRLAPTPAGVEWRNP